MRLKLIAVFMIALIVSLPIYSSAVFAEVTVYETHVKGKDGIEGVTREVDTISFEAVVSIGGDIDLKDNVKYGIKSFDCSEKSEAIANAFKCKYTYETEAPLVIDTHLFNILFYDDSEPQKQIYSKEVSYAVDSLEPAVTRFAIEPKLTKDGKIKVSYGVEDYAYKIKDTKKCAGIDRLEIYDKEDISKPIIELIANTKGGCEWYDSKEIEIKDKTGKITLCARPYDKFVQSPPEFVALDCDAFTIDKEGVDILTESAQLVDNYKLPVTHFKDKVQATFSINISGDDLVEDSVVGDFSALNEDKAEYKSFKTERCDLTSKPAIKNCKWSFEVKLSEAGAGTKTIAIDANDKAGNAAPKTINIPLAYDNVGPVVNKLTTGLEADGRIFAKSAGNKFTAEITEEGWLRKEDVTLHIGSISLQATSCERKSNVVWECKWENVQGSSKTYISTDSKDRLGNAFAEEYGIDVIIDNTAPVINNIKIEQQGGVIGERNVTIGKITRGDILTITANLTEPNGISSAIGDFSIIAKDKSSEPVLCDEIADKFFICTWSGVEVTEPRYKKGNLQFTFKDSAGNIVDYTKDNKAKQEITVYESDVTPQDFYNLKLFEQYLVEIDKEALASLLTEDYREVVPIKLEYKNNCGGDIEIVNLKIDGQGRCNSDRVRLSYSKDSSNNYNGFLEFLIDKSHAQYDEIKIGTKEEPCTLKLNVRCGNKLYATPESEPIAISIPLTSEKTPTEKVNERIDRQKELTGSKFWKLMDKLEDWSNIAQSICRIKNMFGSIQTTFTGIGAIGCACKNSPYIGYICKGLEKVGEGNKWVFERFKWLVDKSFVNEICAFVQCTSAEAQVIGSKEKVDPKFEAGGYCEQLKKYTLAGWGANKIKDPAWAGAVDSFAHTDALELAKKSLIFSAACVCIPGIIYNLHKKRQLECWYGYCLKYLVPAGFPVDECTTQHKYQKCVYLGGQFTVLIDWQIAPLKNIIKMLEHPVASGWVITRELFGRGCGETQEELCAKWTSGWCITHTIMTVVEGMVEIAKTEETIGSLKWKSPEVDYCKLLEEDTKK